MEQDREDFTFEDAKWLVVPGIVGGLLGLLPALPWGDAYGFTAAWWLIVYTCGAGPMFGIVGVVAAVKAAQFYKIRPIGRWWWYRTVVVLLGTVNPLLWAYWAWEIWPYWSS